MHYYSIHDLIREIFRRELIKNGVRPEIAEKWSVDIFPSTNAPYA